MKKIASLLLVSLMLCGGVVAAEVAASPVDLTALSLDELIELHKLVDTEIDARIGREPSMIAAGVYTAGETIKAGAYAITCTDAYSEEGMAIQLYKDYAQYEQCRSVISQYQDEYQIFAGYIQPGQSATVSLSDGMVLVIDGGAGLAETLVSTWAP